MVPNDETSRASTRISQGQNHWVFRPPKKLLPGSMDQAWRLLARSKAAAISSRVREVRRSGSTRGRSCRWTNEVDSARRARPPLLPHSLRLYRAHEPLLIIGG